MIWTEQATAVGPAVPIPLPEVFQDFRILIVYHFVYNKCVESDQQFEGGGSQSNRSELLCPRLFGRTQCELCRFQQRPLERDHRLSRLHELDGAVVLDLRRRKLAGPLGEAGTCAATSESTIRYSKHTRRSGERLKLAHSAVAKSHAKWQPGDIG
jgi:hypothetical protein